MSPSAEATDRPTDPLEVVGVHFERGPVPGLERVGPRSKAPHDHSELGAALQEDAPLRIVAHLQQTGVDDENGEQLAAVELPDGAG